MDINKYMSVDGEKPLDNIVTNGGFCGIFRTIACIGDSLSSGEFESFMNGSPGWHDMYEYSWGQYIARDAGINVKNFSKGGMSAKQYCETFARDNDFWNPKFAAQGYIIALGVNDISQCLSGEYEFGSIEDVDFSDWAKNKPTFAGYYASIIARYKEIQPKAKFFLMTIPNIDCAEERKELVDAHYQLIYDLADSFDNCYVLDLRKYGPKYDAEFKKAFYLASHLNAAGYRLTALMVESYIDYIIRNNPDDFRQIGFVGTPYHNSKFKW